MTEVLKNEVLLWPPPPLSEEGGEAPEEAEETVDLFTLIHSPGKEGEDSKCLPGGPHQLEILLNKVVFDSQTLYPDCTRDVQKRIVGDLQRCYARTGGGRELSVKEWADGNQNRGILRLRLRCKKAKCKLQFQVNWDTVHKHWFITRQCENLVHTCPVPKPKSTTTRRQPKHNNHVAASTPNTKTPINGGVKNDIISEKVVSDEKIPAFVNAPADPPPPVVEVVSSMPPPVQNPTPSQQTSFPAPVVVLSSPQPPPPMPSAPAPMVITEADRAEAELLATDLRGWVPPPDPNNPSPPPPQQPPAPPAIPPPHLAMYDEAALMQSGHAPPPVETLSIPQTKATTQPLPLPQPPQFPAPLQQPPQLPSPTNVHSSSSKVTSNNNNNTLPTPTIQIPTPSQLPNPPSPLSPARCMSGDAAMALNSMSIGANSIAMSVDGDTKEVDVPLLDGTTNDGMSVLSEYDDIMLTLGSISSKQWMNGLSHAPRHSSDHYSSIGSLYNTNNRPPSQQGLVVTTSTSTQLSASATSASNMMINDQTMNSLTDSVRNMLSIVGGTNGIVMPPVGEISSSQGSASFLLGSERTESSNPQPPQGILDNDFFRPPPNLSKDVTPPPAPS